LLEEKKVKVKTNYTKEKVDDVLIVAHNKLNLRSETVCISA
jgi:hypothetical protein